jgi:eukaryotic-like serine/threonine-protein kinase
MPSKPLEPGDPVRLGRFELLGRLGEGGQGIVYLGRGARPGEERVAVKVLRSNADEPVLERLARELAAVHQVQPFVTAGVIEATTDGDRRYVVSEFIDGPSLQERVLATGPLAEGELLRLAVGTATALTAIHGAGVVHRDFKPANVLLGPDGPRVVDFGIARLTDATSITSGVIGTPSYISPEQLAGEQPTSAVDIFAWAVTMIYAATGRTAFGADAVPAVLHRILNAEPDLTGVPPALLPLIRQCLAKDPRRRPTARDVLLGIVDPSARQAMAAGSGPAMAAGPATEPFSDSVPLRHDPAPPLAGGMRPPHLATEPSVPGIPQAYGMPPMAGLPTTPGLPGPRRRGPLLAAVLGAAALAALIVVGVLLLAKGHSPPTTTAGQGHSSPPPATSAPTASAAATSPSATAVASGPKIPAAFAGTWSGTATQSAIANPGVALPNSITLTLAAGGRTAHEVNQDCVNTLTLTKVTDTMLTFDEPAVAGTCVAGTVTLTLKGKGVAYHWTDNFEQNVGDLSKG